MFIFTAIEDKPPHDVGVYRLDDESLECGRVMLEECRAKLYDCLESGRWPGSSWDEAAEAEGIKRIGLPDWLKRHLLRPMSEHV